MSDSGGGGGVRFVVDVDAVVIVVAHFVQSLASTFSGTVHTFSWSIFNFI